MKAEASPDSKSNVASEASTVSSTPDSVSEIDTELSQSQTTDATLRVGSQDEQGDDGRSTKSASSGSQAKGQASKPADQGSSSPSNLIGKINNLVTTDLGNIVDSRDFLYMVLYTPVQIVVGMIFLYNLLGWRYVETPHRRSDCSRFGSTFVGLGVMVALFPIPGYITKLVQDVQVVRLKKTDARVQIVSESG